MYNRQKNSKKFANKINVREEKKSWKVNRKKTSHPPGKIFSNYRSQWDIRKIPPSGTYNSLPHKNLNYMCKNINILFPYAITPTLHSSLIAVQSPGWQSVDAKRPVRWYCNKNQYTNLLQWRQTNYPGVNVAFEHYNLRPQGSKTMFNSDHLKYGK